MSSPDLGSRFDADYFINGIVKRKSLYSNFRWLPHISFPIASTIKRIYPNKTILDYGCAMGYVVYALRLLNVDAVGYDISRYAIENCKREVREYLYCDKKDVPFAGVVFVKDVLEHIPYSIIDEELKWIHDRCKEALFIIPLGENKQYRIPEYAFDRTHIIIENEEWWAKRLAKCGFYIKELRYNIDGFKDNWREHHKYGNAIFMLECR